MQFSSIRQYKNGGFFYENYRNSLSNRRWASCPGGRDRHSASVPAVTH